MFFLIYQVGTGQDFIDEKQKIEKYQNNVSKITGLVNTEGDLPQTAAELTLCHTSAFWLIHVWCINECMRQQMFCVSLNVKDKQQHLTGTNMTATVTTRKMQGLPLCRFNVKN